MAARTPTHRGALALMAAASLALCLLASSSTASGAPPLRSAVNMQTKTMAMRPVMRVRRPRDTVVHSKPCNTEHSNAALLAATAAAAPMLAQSAHAAAEMSKIADMDVPSALISQGIPTVIAGALAVNFLADPERRRQEMTDAAGGDEMASVKNYFNGEGFQRWRKIYGETDEVNSVQKDIRDGHAVTVSKVLNWLDTSVTDKSVCDAGCGTGSLTIPLALKGARVSASDIAVEMTKEAERRFEERKGESAKAVAPVFDARGLEDIEGKYDVVTCLDVMIHYPQDKANGMVKHLASLANEKLIISFAPKTLYYSTLKRIGELFPGPSKATRAYLHAEEDVERALNEVGWKVVKREMTATKFYFSRLLEAVPM